MSIDPRTVILLAGIMGGMMSVVLFVMRRNYPPRICGLGEWAAASALFHIGSQRFLGRPPWMRPWAGLILAALLAQTVGQVVRFFSAFGTTPDSSLFIPFPAQTYFVTAYAFCMLLLCIGVVLMATDKLRAEFEHLASHDSLTGALTRRALIEACEQELERGRRCSPSSQDGGPQLRQGGGIATQ